MSTWSSQVQPVCVAVGGRMGVGKSALVDALTARMAGLGPLAIGELAPSNDPAAWDCADGGAPGAEIPIDIAVHMVHRAPQDSDRAAIRGHRARGVPVLGVLARADSIGDCWAVANACAELPLIPVELAPGVGEPRGLEELAACLSAGIAEILAGRADRRLAALDRAAVEGGPEGGERDRMERLLRGPEALRQRMSGAANWEVGDGSARGALAEAARWRALANSARDPADAERARNWHRRQVARAVQLGACARGGGEGGARERWGG